MLPDTPISTVADARAELSATLRRFRADPSASPVILGSHRRPEAALVPYALYETLRAGTSAPSTVPMLDQLKARADIIRRLAQSSRIRSVSVFGSVARGAETAESDVDLLIDPDEHMSLFDLAQFARDMEQLLERPVDTVSRRALSAEVDAVVLAEAIPL